MYCFFIFSRAGPRYLRGSNSAGFFANTSRTAAVIARRESESMLILQTALFAALRSCSSGIPTAAFNAPPYLLIVSTSSCGTDDEPWSTIGNPGSSFSIAARTSNANGGGTRRPVCGSTVHCSGVNLKAPCEVPIEIANESQPVLVTKSTTSSGLV